MIIGLGILIFIIGCCLSTYEDTSYNAQARAEKRHLEIMKALENKEDLTPKKEKRTQRRLAKDKEGNLLAEEIIEEVER